MEIMKDRYSFSQDLFCRLKSMLSSSYEKSESYRTRIFSFRFV